MRENFSLVAVLLSAPLLALPPLIGVRTHGDEQGIPLLTVLLMNEFGFVLTAAGGVAATLSMRKTGYRHKQAMGLIFCAMLALSFLWTMIRLYPAEG